MKAKIIVTDHSILAEHLEDRINRWIERNEKKKEIIDIKISGFQSIEEKNTVYTMILYKDRKTALKKKN